MQKACCRWPACRTPHPTDPATLLPTTVANTTHVLLHCPLARPAAAWLCNLWAAIDSGNAPPDHPRRYHCWRPHGMAPPRCGRGPVDAAAGHVPHEGLGWAINLFKF